MSSPSIAHEGEMIELTRLERPAETYPRDERNDERIRDFVELYRERGPCALPAIKVAQSVDGRLWLYDGEHRVEAALKVGFGELPTEIKVLLPGALTKPIETVYRLAVEEGSRSPLAFTTAEKKRAARRIRSANPHMSNRELGRILGVAHTTLARWCDAPLSNDPAGRTGSGRLLPSADEVANRLVRAVSKLYEARGLLDGLRGGDAVMGKRLARAFAGTHGESALEWAHRYQAWIAAAVAELESGESG